MPADLADLAHRLLDLARRAGADQADAMAVEGAALSIDVRGGRLEQAERAESLELGLRVLVGQRQAIVSVSDARAQTLADLAERTVAMAREAPEDPHAGLARADQLAAMTDATGLDLVDPAPEPEPAALEEAARRAEAAALAVAGVSQVQSASASHARRRAHLATTAGFSAGSARTETGLSCSAIAGTGTGMERDYDYDQRIHAGDLDRPEEIGRRAGERAAERLNPVKPPTGRWPVLFDERISASLIGHLLAAINGGAVARGQSWLLDALGAPVLPEGMTLAEDPHRPRIAGSRRFDAEGLPTRARDIVADGRLMTWTLDLATARRLGMESTGNAMRGAGSLPSPGVTNVSLSQGAASRADLIRDMGTGFWVTSMIGATINPNTGDYSRGAAGFWVENGRVLHPVSEGTVAGSLREMLRRIVPANDGRPHLGRVVPSILIDGLTVAGA